MITFISISFIFSDKSRITEFRKLFWQLPSSFDDTVVSLHDKFTVVGNIFFKFAWFDD